MNKSCIRETGSTEDLNLTNQNQNYFDLSANKNELSKSIEVCLFTQKRKDIIVQNISQAGITVEMQSNLRPPKKSPQFRRSNKIGRANQSIVLKPKTLMLPRLHDMGSQSQQKKLIQQRSKSSKRSIHLRRILSYGQSLRGEKKIGMNLICSNDNNKESKLQKLGTEKIFLLPWSKNKNSLSFTEPTQDQDLMKQLKVKKFEASMFREESVNRFIPNNPKKSRQ